MQIVVVGAGMAGLTAALAATWAGHEVQVVSTTAVPPAHEAAAGMLAPWSELDFTEPDLFMLGTESVAAYAGFVERINEGAPRDEQVHIRPTGTVLAAYDADDAAMLRDTLQLHAQHGHPSDWQSIRAVRTLEPGLSTKLKGAAVVDDDKQIDPPSLHRAMVGALRRAGVPMLNAHVDAIDHNADGATVHVDAGPGRAVNDVETAASSSQTASELHADTVIVAAGAKTSALLPRDAVQVPVRPVCGTTLRVRPRGAPPLHRTVRALVARRPLYAVPTVNDELVIGATQLDRGFSEHPTVEEIFELVRAARAIVPELSDAEVVSVRHRWRPTTPDHLPAVGYVADHIAVCTGHHRGGVLLAAWTQDVVCRVLEGTLRDQDACVDPRRFG